MTTAGLILKDKQLYFLRNIRWNEMVDGTPVTFDASVAPVANRLDIGQTNWDLFFTSVAGVPEFAKYCGKVKFAAAAGKNLPVGITAGTTYYLRPIGTGPTVELYKTFEQARDTAKTIGLQVLGAAGDDAAATITPIEKFQYKSKDGSWTALSAPDFGSCVVIGKHEGLSGETVGIFGNCSLISGDATGLAGDVSTLRGSITNIDGVADDVYGYVGNITGVITDCTGDLSNIIGSVTRITGDCSKIKGSVSGLIGSVSNLIGTVTGISGSCTGISGDCSSITGTVTNILGSVTNISGNVSNISKTVSLISGNVSKIRGEIAYDAVLPAKCLIGDVTGISGNVTGVYGDATGRYGNLDLCNITTADRTTGVDITTVSTTVAVQS